MTQKIPPTSGNPLIFCPTCGTQVDSELVSDLAEGITIYCASCGHKFDYSTHKHRFKASSRSSVPSPPAPRKYATSSISQSKQPQSAYTPASSSNNSGISKLKDDISNASPDYSSKEYKQYRRIQKDNRKEFRKTRKQNKKNFKIPQNQTKNNFQHLMYTHRQNFQRIQKENKRVYQITLLSNISAKPSTIQKIKRDYRKIKRKNRREFVRKKRKYARSHKRILRSNRKIYRETRRANREVFDKIREGNEAQWQKYSLTLNAGDLKFGHFQPIFTPSENFRVFDPTIFTPHTPEIFDPEGENRENLSITQRPVSHSNTIKPKVARFDSITGKPLKPKVRFDSLTGKPLDLSENLDKEDEVQTIKESILPEKMPASIRSGRLQEIMEQETSSENQITSEETEEDTSIEFKEIYTVLDSDVREELLNLPISEDEQDMIAKSFIYLNHEQQLKYLEELSTVNLPDLEARKELIEVIENLPIPPPQKEFLLEQLEYLNEDEQTEFVTILEKSKTEENLTQVPAEEQEDSPQNSVQSPAEEQPESPIIPETQPKSPITESSEEQVKEVVDPEMEFLEQERNRLLQLKQEKAAEAEKQRKLLERQKLEEERLARVKKLKEKIKTTTEEQSGKKKDSKSSEASTDKKKKIHEN